MPTAIDLFAGAGGFGLGFEMAGFDIHTSLEIDGWACDTLRYNRPQMTVIQGDITAYDDPSTIQAACGVRPDVVIGGPPCQGYSIAGPAKKDPNDPRNTLFESFARWIACLEPRAFVMENVKGLLSRRNAEGEKVIDIIQRTFEEIGYFTEVWVLNAARYGVPQQRERVFIVGHTEDAAIGVPASTHAMYSDGRDMQLALVESDISLYPITLWEAISDLPELEASQGQEEQDYRLVAQTEYQQWVRMGSPALYNHVAMEHTPRMVERFKHIQWGQSSADVPVEHRAHKRNGAGDLSGIVYDQNNRRLFPHRPSHTIAASFYANFVHPFQHRNITAREGARIQSFPDYYRFMGKKTVVSQKLLTREERFGETFLCQYNQIGNAVPPLLASAVARHLLESLGL